MPETEVDVAIVGSGPVGCALALALADTGLEVKLLGSRVPNPHVSFRPLALSYASSLILERVGAWENLETTPIEQIHVSQAGGFGRTRIAREELALPALGYVVDYSNVATHFAALVNEKIWLDAATPRPAARLVVHAEGTPPAGSPGRDYGHTALVAVVESDRSAHGTAWERFTPEGPLALLPVGAHYGVVWSRRSESAATLMSLDDTAFLAELQGAFGRRAGSFVAAGRRAAVPLVLRYRTAPASPGEVHIGNAAQTLHPVAGQGLNLGLRDAWELAQLVRGVAASDLGSARFAAEFARRRRVDSAATIRATDLMATLFVKRDPVTSALRGAALTALDLLPPARRFFARRMIFGASAW